MVRMFRQGDLLIKEIKSVPQEAKISADKVLAYGEATGHKHQIVGQMQVFRDGNRQFLEGNGQLVHEEHGPLELEGTYEVIRQREYSPLNNRTVVD